ncbi:MAG: prepilin peptidase [Rickettsiales bacterium]
MQNGLILFLVVLTGLCFGSFITLLSYRLPRQMQIGATRSKCPNCKTPLGFKDLFPVLSWLTSGGKCRHCGKKIHWRYPLVEILTAILFLVIVLQVGLTYEAAIFALLGVCIIALCVIDFEHRIIPDELQWAMFALAVLHHFLLPVSWWDKITGAVIGVAIGAALKYGFLWLRKKDGLGMGDVKFLLVAGFWLGTLPLVPFLFLSGLLGIVTAFIWKYFNDDRRFPFGPALALSMFALLLFPSLDALFWETMNQIVTR